MTTVVEKALALWGLDGAVWHLVAARENQVFKVTTRDRTFALRLHGQDYRTNAELWSELAWMDAVAQGGIAVPAPVRSAMRRSGAGSGTIPACRRRTERCSWPCAIRPLPPSRISGTISTTA
ncbi:phosphotransferase [uncultured Roseovarius sp.]|uniref:phosphotransferase n=1 Tax=uncultured Roseovarius sp. TaxID=293344 RepID=UPI0026126F3B|nr:phosphotransferase [uncultured Roseovarius sp.]